MFCYVCTVLYIHTFTAIRRRVRSLSSDAEKYCVLASLLVIRYGNFYSTEYRVGLHLAVSTYLIQSDS